jgi:site-specific DNA-methyltransferase (adenine-specific)
MTLELFNANCLEHMKTIADKSIDLIICDLPYGCLIGGGEEKKKRHFVNGVDTGTEIKQTEGVIAGCSWDIKLDLNAFWIQIKRIRKDDHTPCIHFCSTKFGYDLIKSNEKEFRYDLVWNKLHGVGFLSANKKPISAHEMIYVFSKQGASYKRIDITGDFKKWTCGKNGLRTGNHADAGLPRNNTEGGDKTRCFTSVLEFKGVRSNFKGDKKEHKHPTEKPIELYKWLINRYSKEGDKVLDPTFGSCNSGLACKELKRNYIGIEMNKPFFDKANKSLILNEE